jgi:hypothetical protein
LNPISKPKPEEFLARVDFLGSAIPMCVFDTETLAFLAVNDAAVLQYGYSREEFLTMTILDIRPSDDIVPLLREELEERRHNSIGERWRHIRKDGSLFNVEITSYEAPFRGRPAELVIARDLSQGGPTHKPGTIGPPQLARNAR